jgi:ABC-type maltose transport system permease subunit
MAMVQPKSQKARLFITHLLLLLFIAAIMFPLLMVVAISLRQGNFATGSLIPEQISWDHWKLALGFSVEQADGRIPGTAVAVELGKGRRDFRDWHCGALHHLRLRFRPYALSRQSDAAERNADFPDVPGSTFTGRVVCVV